jgi:hypothetical protein
MLTFAEIKLYENQELRAELLPPVCRQLKTYANLIAQQRTELLEAYEAVRMAYRSFKGPFFERRGVMFDKNLDLDPVPRLLIYGYDQQQEKDAKSLGLRIAHSMREQCGLPGFSDRHVLAKGNIESFTDGDFA